MKQAFTGQTGHRGGTQESSGGAAVLVRSTMMAAVPVRGGGPHQRGRISELGRIELTLPLHDTVVRLARHAVRPVSTTWGDLDASDAVLLVLSELLSNAVKAATGDSVTLVLTWTLRRVRIAVADGSNDLPVVRQAVAADEGGRGLWLVDTLAVRWGSDPTGRGKWVWAEVALR